MHNAEDPLSLLYNIPTQGESGDEAEEEERGVGARERARARHEAATSDAHLSPEDRLKLYDSQKWRMEVSLRSCDHHMTGIQLLLFEYSLGEKANAH